MDIDKIMESNPPIDSVLNPEPHSPPAGDWTDDDGQALDSYFEAADLGPLLYKLVQAVGTIKKPTSERIVRTKVFFADIVTASNPYPARLALPPDDNRTLLAIHSSDNAFNKGLFFHSERFDVLGGSDSSPETNAGFINKSIGQLVLPNYTGPLWVGPDGAGSAGQCVWHIISVTS